MTILSTLEFRLCEMGASRFALRQFQQNPDLMDLDPDTPEAELRAILDRIEDYRFHTR